MLVSPGLTRRGFLLLGCVRGAWAWCVAMVAGAARLAGVAWRRWPGRGRLGTSGDVWRCLGGGVGWWVAAPGRWHLVEVDLGGPAGRGIRYLAGARPWSSGRPGTPPATSRPGDSPGRIRTFPDVNSVNPGIDFWR